MQFYTYEYIKFFNHTVKSSQNKIEKFWFVYCETLQRSTNLLVNLRCTNQFKSCKSCSSTILENPLWKKQNTTPKNIVEITTCKFSK